MREAMDETDRRRAIQQDYNVRYDITPETIVKNVSDSFGAFFSRDRRYVVIAVICSRVSGPPKSIE